MLIHPDLYEIADAAAVVGGDAYRLLEAERRIPAAAEGEPESMLLRSLESEMYYRLYRRPSSAPAGGGGTSVDAMRSFTAALSEANRGSGTWDPGWQVEGRLEDGDVLVRRDGARYRAAEPDIRRSSGLETSCRVRVPKEMRQLVRGFYMALGDADWPERIDQAGALIRFYWSLQADHAASYLAEVTGRLNARGVPFRTKVVQDPNGYVAADAGVLYLPAAEVEPLWPDLLAIYKRVRDGLRPSVPMFAHRLSPGLGYAEDPGDGLSFGQARCRSAAAGLWRAFQAGEHDREARARHLAAAFSMNGVDPAAPFRRQGGASPAFPPGFGN